MDISSLKGRRGIGAWVRWAVREKGLVAFFIIALLAAGIFGLTRMNKDEFPTFEIKQGLVAGIYPGATAAQVEERLTRPLEEFLFTFREIDRSSIHSVTRDGICYIYVDMRVSVPQSKKDEIWSKIKLGLQNRKLTLPSGVLAVAVLDDFSNTSSLLVAMESPDKSYTELEYYATSLADRLREIPQLAKAEILGSNNQEIAVTLDREKLSAYGIDPAALMLEYRASTIGLPSGTYTSPDGTEPVHVKDAISSEREISERIIWSDPDGNVVRLKDVATIQRRYASPAPGVSYNGHSCLVLNIEMRPDNDITAFGRKVDKILSDFSSTLPPSITLSRICDQPKVVSRSVWSFLRDLLISMLVVIVVMLMLFPLRPALIASSGVPVCTGVAIALMYITGMPLNTVTLAALIVCLGMIVDDSIITMDGYMDKSLKGLKGVDAAASSASELFMPTFIATAAICLMFFPIKVIISGYLGDFVKLFPWVILFALMTSLLYAVTVVPSLEVRFIRSDENERKNFISRAQDKFFRVLQTIYEGALKACFRHPVATILFGFVTIALGIAMFMQLNFQMIPKAARDFFVVEMYLEPGKGLQKTKERADSLSAILLSDSRTVSVTSFYGMGAPRFAATYTPILPSSETAQLIVNTRSTKATEELLKDYCPRYEHIFPDVTLRFKQMDYQPVESPICVNIKGNDRMAMLSTAQRIAGYLRSLQSETQWVHSDAEQFGPEVSINLNKDEAARLGVSKAVVSLSLAGSFGATEIASLWEDGHEIPVNLYSEESEPGYIGIGDRMIQTRIPGVSVPLRQIADLVPEWNLATLFRDNGSMTFRVACDLKYGVSQPAVEKKVKDFVRTQIAPDLPDGVRVEFGGLSSINQKVIPEIGISFAVACFILFLSLLIHFRKTSIALLTMATSTLCLFGASLGLWLFGLDFTITAVLGLISLVGIIVRNGILMFEYAEDERFKRGESVMDAAIHAGQRRMRPIFLTSCTTALGVLPMILSGDLLWMPMGVTICFGTLLSIFLITLIMPVTYWQIYKRADKES